METCEHAVKTEKPITGDPLNRKFVCIKCGRKETEKLFNIPKSDVPEHVKQYGKHKTDYRCTSEHKINAYF